MQAGCFGRFVPWDECQLLDWPPQRRLTHAGLGVSAVLEWAERGLVGAGSSTLLIEILPAAEGE